MRNAFAAGKSFICAEIVTALGTASTFAFTAVLTVILLVIPNEASHGNDHRNDRPRGDSAKQREEDGLGDIIETCLGAEEFGAQVAECAQLLSKKNARGTCPSFSGRLKRIIR
jgi:hypothetical protein